MLVLQDLAPDDAFKDKKFALEAEIAKIDAEEFNEKVERCFEDYSGRIWEAEGVHKFSEENRKKFIDFCKERYEDNLPWGNDGYLSGGNHLHIFINEETFNHVHRWGSDHLQLIDDWHRYCPLYAIHCPVSGKWFQRRNIHSKFFEDARNNWNTYTRPPIDYKGICFTLKDSYTSVDDGYYEECDYCCGEYDEDDDDAHCTCKKSDLMSVEFRFNQVLDPRIVGYYLGMMLLYEAKAEPTKGNKEDTRAFNNLAQGISKYCGECSKDENIDEDGTYYGYNVKTFSIKDNPSYGFVVNDEIVKANVDKILETLKEFNMVKAHAGLVEYLIERKIPFTQEPSTEETVVEPVAETAQEVIVLDPVV